MMSQPSEILIIHYSEIKILQFVSKKIDIVKVLANNMDMFDIYIQSVSYGI